MSKEFSEEILIQKNAAELLEKKLGPYQFCIMPEQMSVEIEV